MWPFNRYKIFRKELITPGFIDWHCHILPSVDDGVQTMEDALAILRRYEELGVAEVWLTPHVMEDIPNTTDELRQRFSELKSAYTGHVKLHLGAENMLICLMNGLQKTTCCQLTITTFWSKPPILVLRFLYMGHWEK